MSATAAAASGADKGGAKEAKKGGKKKLILIVVVVLIAAGAGGWFSGIIPGLLHGKEHEGAASAEGHEAAATVAAPLYIDVPDMIANMNTGGRRAAYIKLKAKLEVARKEDLATVQNAMPRVVDLFQGYLREMRPEELRGTAGTYRLREELVARTNVAAAPAKVLDVLIVELLVQ